MTKFPAHHPQPHVPIKSSGNKTDLGIHPLWPTLLLLFIYLFYFIFFFFFVNAK